MSVTRSFLGWDGPCLTKAALWLSQHYARAGVVDLGHVTVVVPARRAGRRLLEILAESCDKEMLIPPRIVTTGGLPEELFQPDHPVADDLRCLLTRMGSLQQSKPPVIGAITTTPPRKNDIRGWMALARDLAQLHESLAAELVSVGEVADRAEKVFPLIERDRWNALAALQEAYQNRLEQDGFIDPHMARKSAIEQHVCATDRDIILLACTDLNQVHRRMIRQVAGRVTALIHAPDNEAGGFDEIGCLNVEYWTARKLNISQDTVHIVDHAREQPLEVLKVLEQVTHGPLPLADSHSVSPDDITIGLGDQKHGPLIQRMLDLADLPVRSALGRPFSRSRAAMLLATLADYLSERRFDSFAALLRHPDIEAYAIHHVSPPQAAQGVQHWLTLLDQYLADHLQGQLTQNWLGDEGRAATLKAVHDCILALLPSQLPPLSSLASWSSTISGVLQRVYGDQELLGRSDEDSDLIHALELIATALNEQAHFSSVEKWVEPLSLPDAIRLTLDRLSDGIFPPQGGPPPIEMLGWLELQLDDAPILIIAGFNDGLIPESVNADAFLPDSMRRILGLTDNSRRYARDMAALCAILHSRPGVTFISARRGHEDEPLTPSRLWLARENDQLAPIIEAFFAPDKEQASRPPAPLLLQSHPQGQSLFIVPPPLPPDKPIESLRVTAFRDYLSCPYRFYLKHVRGLETLHDYWPEMDALSFGSLAHQVLREFGTAEPGIRDATNALSIERYLLYTLDQLALSRHASGAGAAVRIQVDQLRERLKAFARWQAVQAGAGWRILDKHVEARIAAKIDVAGQPFTITGQIDRIDIHPELGHRIIDYKTADTPKTPENIHRRSDQWIDLQLPLYRTLASSIGITGPMELGYVQLPRRIEDVDFAAAAWTEDEITDALDEARDVIRKIRDGIFGPPKYPVDYYTEFSGICMDDVIDREAALQAGRALRWRAKR